MRRWLLLIYLSQCAQSAHARDWKRFSARMGARSLLRLGQHGGCESSPGKKGRSFPAASLAASMNNPVNHRHRILNVDRFYLSNTQKNNPDRL